MAQVTQISEPVTTSKTKTAAKTKTLEPKSNNNENNTQTTIQPSSEPASKESTTVTKYTAKSPLQNYCYRHHPDLPCNHHSTHLMHLQNLNDQLQTLDSQSQSSISQLWSLFSSAPAAHRTLILKGILAQCCFPQLSQVAEMVQEAIRIDFVTALPKEIGFKILMLLDSTSLCNAAQVCKRWKAMADDDVVWHRLCEQHIDKKCRRCGWGLPLLERKRLREAKKAMERKLLNGGLLEQPQQQEPPRKKMKSTRPWKDVYSERYIIEANWRSGRHTQTEFQHDSAVLCLQFDEQYLITGTSLGKVYIWDLETGKQLRRFQAHGQPLTALKFDSSKLVTASHDTRVRIWNYKTGEQLGTFNSQSPVQTLDFDQRVIVCGCSDGMIRLWDFENKTCFALTGHVDAITSVKLKTEAGMLVSGGEDATVRLWDLKTRRCIQVFSREGSTDAHVAQVTCVLPLVIDHLESETGCAGMVVGLSQDDFAVVNEDREQEEARNRFNDSIISSGSMGRIRRSSEIFQVPQLQRQDIAQGQSSVNRHESAIAETSEEHNPSAGSPTHILTSSLDATIKLWDIRTGRLVRTLFGHIEGVWDLSADNFRVVSASHDKTVKVWDLQTGRNWHTFHYHSGPVCSTGLSDTKLASGSDDCTVRLLSFDSINQE